MLPDDGDYAETCWICFNVNFNTPFKNLCISWCKNCDSIKMRGTTVKVIVGPFGLDSVRSTEETV